MRKIQIVNWCNLFLLRFCTRLLKADINWTSSLSASVFILLNIIERLQWKNLRRLILDIPISIFVGGEAGFVNNGLFIFKSGHRSGDYHDDMNYKNYSRCMETQLIPNLPLRSVVVMDNASYHNVVAIKHPTANINKREMLAWLDERGIYYGENPTKPLLYSLIRKYKSDYLNYSTDAVVSRYGHLAALELVSKL